MENKICIITRANAGIGKETSIQIASKGHKVILGCRNKLRGEAALKEVKQKSKNNSVELFRVDMSIQGSIREFSELIKSKFDKIDVLIHNAAAFDLSQKRPLLHASSNQ